MKINKNLFVKLLKLYTVQNWLSERENLLIDLFDLLGESNEQELIIDLLYKFKFLDSSQFNESLEMITKYVQAQSEFTAENTQIVPLANDSAPDSSDQMVQAI